MRAKIAHSGWSALIACELVLAAIPAAALAAILAAAAYAQRGYFGFGGEWLVVATVFCVGYATIHRAVCDRIFGRRQDR